MTRVYPDPQPDDPDAWSLEGPSSHPDGGRVVLRFLGPGARDRARRAADAEWPVDAVRAL